MIFLYIAMILVACLPLFKEGYHLWDNQLTKKEYGIPQKEVTHKAIG